MAGSYLFPTNTPSDYRQKILNESTLFDGRLTYFNSDGARSTELAIEATTINSLKPEAGKAIFIDSLSISAEGPCRCDFVVLKTGDNWNIIGDDVSGANRTSYWSATFGKYGGNQTFDFDYFLNTDTLRLQVYGLNGYIPNVSGTVSGLEITNDLDFGASKVVMVVGDSISWSELGRWRESGTSKVIPNMKYNATTDNLPDHFGKTGLWGFRLVNQLRHDGKSVRLVNKGFGGSTLIKKQWASLLNGNYDNINYDLTVVTLGANDCREAWTLDRIDAFKFRLSEFIRHRDMYRPKAHIVFVSPWLLDDSNYWDNDSADSTCRNTVDRTGTGAGSPYNAYPYAQGASYQDPNGKTRLRIVRDLIYEVVNGTYQPNVKPTNSGHYDPLAPNIDRTKGNIHFVEGCMAEHPTHNVLHKASPDANYGERTVTTTGSIAGNDLVITNGILDTVYTFSTGVLTRTGTVGNFNAAGTTTFTERDWIFKDTGDDTTSEQRIGFRVHRAPIGHMNAHKVIYDTVKDITF